MGEETIEIEIYKIKELIAKDLTMQIPLCEYK